MVNSKKPTIVSITRVWPVSEMQWTQCPAVRAYLASHDNNNRKFGPIILCRFLL